MSFSLITGPSDEVLTFADMQLHLSLDPEETEMKSLVEGLITAARVRCETYTRRRFITQQVRFLRDGFDCLELPIGPIQSVDKVEYIAADGSWTEVPDTDYRLIQSEEPNTLVPSYGNTWPTPRDERANVRIDLTVGYGAEGSDVPADIMQSVKFITAHLFDHREDFSGNEEGNRLFGAEANLQPYVLWV